MRAAVFTLVLLCGFVAAHARASAAAEFCPATIVGGAAQVDPSSYRFRLGAISARSVSGFVRLRTKSGWYNAPFSNVSLTSSAKQYNDNGVAFSHEDFLSDDIVVHFPAAQTVTYAYVSQVQTKGETLLDWDKEGSVTCLPTPQSTPAVKPTPAPPLPPLSKSAARIEAHAIDLPLSENCTNAFADVRMLKAGPFRMPAMFGRDSFTARPTGVATVVVAVERDGSVVDAWLWETTGTPLLDDAVVDEARKSTYTPGRAFCENVPGYFVLRSEFRQ